MLQRILLAIAFVLALCTLPGCVSLPGGDKFGVEDVVIKNISAADGITVAIRGTECNFSFTTDRAVIFSELQKCVLGDETSTGLLLASVNKSSISGAPIPDSEVFAVHEQHQKELDVDKAAALILAQAEKVTEEVPITPQ